MSAAGAADTSTILCLLALSSYHVLFFGRLYANPMQMATSELLSTFFPSWIHLGRRQKHDPYYWLNFGAHPVLSSFYPPHFLSAVIGVRLKIDSAFRLLLFSMLGHLLFASVGWFSFLRLWTDPLIALFGAVTLTYQAFNLKQQPCLIYTLGWFPWTLHPNPIVSCIAVAMMILAGYFPYAVYLLPVTFLAHIWLFGEINCFFGILLAAPQIIPFLRYLPKTIKKMGEGRLGPWELKFYFGLTPIVILFVTLKLLYLIVLVPILLSFCLKKWLPRGYQRMWIWSVYIAMIFCVQAMMDIQNQTVLFTIITIQAFDLWLHNSQLLPPRPFCELPIRPSKAFNTKLTRYLGENLDPDARVSGLPWPLFTGHINKFKTLGYCGSMQLKLMAKWRGDKDPNGSGHHDYFMGKEDGNELDVARVQFAYSRKKLNWPRTAIRNLYVNPRYRSA